MFSSCPSVSGSVVSNHQASIPFEQEAWGVDEHIHDVASRLADNKSSDIRIEAAIAKLYGSELGWKVVDELMQIRGGRGFETAESLRARGEKPVEPSSGVDANSRLRASPDQPMQWSTSACWRRSVWPRWWS